jgi:septum formation protein
MELLMTKKIILASQSPRRKELLSLANIEYTVQVANTDETYPAGLGFDEIAIYIAKEKAEKIAAQHSEAIVIAADTIVICNNTILGKPIDEADATHILQQLSDNTHTVITGVCIKDKEKTVQFADSTVVHFHKLTLAQIEYYVKTYKPFDKAGAYAIQEWIGAIGIKRIEGDFYNVMGLPISRVVQELALFA